MTTKINDQITYTRLNQFYSNYEYFRAENTFKFQLLHNEQKEIKSSKDLCCKHDDENRIDIEERHFDEALPVKIAGVAAGVLSLNEQKVCVAEKNVMSDKDLIYQNKIIDNETYASKLDEHKKDSTATTLSSSGNF